MREGSQPAATPATCAFVLHHNWVRPLPSRVQNTAAHHLVYTLALLGSTHRLANQPTSTPPTTSNLIVRAEVAAAKVIKRREVSRCHLVWPHKAAVPRGAAEVACALGAAVALAQRLIKGNTHPPAICKASHTTNVPAGGACVCVCVFTHMGGQAWQKGKHTVHCRHCRHNYEILWQSHLCTHPRAPSSSTTHLISPLRSPGSTQQRCPTSPSAAASCARKSGPTAAGGV